ncbi:MFS transporter [Williamsia sp.]|uniref:MFS transporter n=1 Tax=Williamsia sp. TaxID=1872085 RepID=UPI001A27A03E|nr:MFS transporter [Williamsia sp.]MBJ7289466.1 MFS transporter [Williamsia sp.]
MTTSAQDINASDSSSRPHSGATDISPRVRLTIIAVLAASMLLPFAVTGPAVILPDLAHGLGAGSGASQWVQNAYNTIFAAAVLAAGSLADRVGRRRVLRTGIAIFALSAAGIAAAPDILVVDILRGVQGLGAAGIVSAGAAVLAHATSGSLRVAAFGMLGASFGAGLAIGPVAAGALGMIGWRAVFVAIAIVSGIAFVLSRMASESRDDEAGRLDVGGMVTFGGALALLSFGFVSASGQGWLSAPAMASFVAAVVLIAVFVVVELRNPAAMFDVRLFRSAAFTAVICQPFAVTFGFVVLLVYLPIYLQGVAGAGEFASAAALLPMTVPVLLLPLAARRLTAAVSVRMILVVASVCIGTGLFGMTAIAPHDSALRIAVPLLVFGIGVGLAFCVMDNAAVSTVPVTKAGAAAGMFNTMRITGESLAVAAAAAVLVSLTAGRVGGASAADALQGQAVDPATDAALTDAMRITFLALAVLAWLAAAFTAWAMRSGDRVAGGGGQ